MDQSSLPVFRHVITQCPCGHASHIGRGLERMTSVVCPECDELAGDGVLTVAPLERLEMQPLNIGAQVRYDGHTMVVRGVEQITKLDGRITTGFVRVLLAKEGTMAATEMR